MELADHRVVRTGLPRLTRRPTSERELGGVICASDACALPTAPVDAALSYRGRWVLCWIDSLLGLLAKVLKAFMKWW